MKAMFAILAIVSVAPLTYAEQSSWIPTSDTYRSGFEICEKDNADPKEIARRLFVPVDYKQPEREKTSIYYWLHKPFNESLPTAVFISGGPGDTSHNTSFDVPGWNIVFFDQRGNTCSRPENFNNYLSPSFYSSENTARDIEEIRRDLKIAQISVYGVSYGTVPAQIYAHFFPAATRSLVLEGIVHEGGQALIAPERKKELLQQYFDQQPENLRSKILDLANIEPLWFSGLASNSLYQDDPFFTLDHLLGYIFALEQKEALNFIANFLPRAPTPSTYGFDHVMMGMIGCQELGMNIANLSSHLKFKDGIFVPSEQNHFYGFYCIPLGLETVESKIYDSKNYPSKVPVTYIQGLLDGATTADAAIKHFKVSRSRQKQLVLVGKGGHLPLFGTLNSGYNQGSAAVLLRQEFLGHALSGATVSKNILQDLKKATDLNWKLWSPAESSLF